MKHHLCGVVALFAFTLAMAPIAAMAQSGAQYATPLNSSCISQFWDGTMYNWMSYQNNCGEPVHLMWYARTKGGGFSDDIRAGGKSNTGFSHFEVNDMGGFTLFVCPKGYLPVDSSGLQVHDANASYRCKKM